MDDAWNPTPVEIVSWAYSDAPVPEQDWELAVIADINLETILKLATDLNCPHQEFFVNCLYFMVGDAIRSNWGATSRDSVERILQEASSSESQQIRRWSIEAQGLIANPKSFKYDLWCDGKLASRNKP